MKKNKMKDTSESEQEKLTNYTSNCLQINKENDKGKNYGYMNTISLLRKL